MSKLKTALEVFKSDKHTFRIVLFTNLNRLGLFNVLSDRFFLKILYRVHFGKRLNLRDPKTFNQKLQWLKLYDRNPKYSILVDKYEVKEYIAKTIGEQYVIPTIGVWNTVDEIDWKSLPNQFVIKCTHDSGSVIVCKNKEDLDLKKACDSLGKCLKRNMFYWGREWPYRNVRPRIIAEKYMCVDKPELTDYKFMCFNGKVKCTFLCTNRFSEGGLRVTFYDNDWKKMPFERHYPSELVPAEKPHCYDEMVFLAEKLSSGIPFVRVDFYEIGGHPFFGEMTFFPGNGTEEFTPEVWDTFLGDMIKLPNLNA